MMPRSIPRSTSAKPRAKAASKPAPKPASKARVAPKAPQAKIALPAAPRLRAEPTVQLADALDSMAVALHKGKKVLKADIEAAGLAAHHLRPRHAPEESANAVRFESARAVLLINASGAAAGKSPATWDAEDAARRLAVDLRGYATHTVPEPVEAGSRARPGEVAARLKRRYARLGK